MTSQTISKIDTATRAADKPIDHQSVPTAAVIETTMTTPPPVPHLLCPNIMGWSGALSVWLLPWQFGGR